MGEDEKGGEDWGRRRRGELGCGIFLGFSFFNVKLKNEIKKIKSQTRAIHIKHLI